MAASQSHITPSTPMGANLVDGGVTFRVWAPGATHVHVALNGDDGYRPRDEDELVKDPVSGHWTGFFPGAGEGTLYRFYLEGPGDKGFKRDPWARELELHDHANTDGIVRDPDDYPWHDDDFRAPAIADLVVYQLHIGRFYARDDYGGDRRPYRVAKFLDVLHQTTGTK